MLDFWTGDQGDRYVARNTIEEDVATARIKMWRRILNSTYPNEPKSLLEVGANIGRNLRALRLILPGAKLYGVEPNQQALRKLKGSAFVDAERIHEASADDLPFADDSIDMVFTCGVLIHIPPHERKAACEEMLRVAKQWVVAIEYFAPSCEMIRYQGEDNRLWRDDYGSYWADEFGLKPVTAGFEWKRLTGLDHLTWWLLKKS